MYVSILIYMGCFYTLLKKEETSQTVNIET